MRRDTRISVGASLYWSAASLESLTNEKLVDALETDLYLGLTHREALARKRQFGPNLLYPSKWTIARPVLRVIYESIFSVPTVLSAVALGFAGRCEMWHTLAGTKVAILIFWVCHCWDRYHSVKKIPRLGRHVPKRTNVIRMGLQQGIDSKDVVIGDVVALTRGTVLPADVRIVDSDHLQVCQKLYGNASILDVTSGTLLPTGSRVVSGTGRGFVTAAGRRSTLSGYLQHLSKGIGNGHQGSITAMQVKWIYRVGFLVAGVLVMTELEKHLVRHTVVDGHMMEKQTEFFRRSLGAIMSAFPIALDPIVRLSNRVGLRRFRRYAWKLTYKSVESLATLTNVILPHEWIRETSSDVANISSCRMYVAEEWYSFDATSLKRHAGKFAAGCTDLMKVIRGEHMGALLRFLAIFAGLDGAEVDSLRRAFDARDREQSVNLHLDSEEDVDGPKYVILDFHRATADHPLSTVAIMDSDQELAILVSKGALSSILPSSKFYRDAARQKSRLTDASIEKLYTAEQDLARSGYHVVAVATRMLNMEELDQDGGWAERRHGEEDMIILGLVAIGLADSDTNNMSKSDHRKAHHYRNLQMLEDRIQFHIVTPEHFLDPITTLQRSMQEMASNPAFFRHRNTRAKKQKAESFPFANAIAAAEGLKAVDAREFHQMEEEALKDPLLLMPDVIGHAGSGTIEKLGKALIGRYSNVGNLSIQEPSTGKVFTGLPILDIRCCNMETPNLFADIVLQDASLSGLMHTIKLSRSIFSRSCEVTTLVASAHCCEVIIQACDSFIQTERPVLDPFQMLYTNLVTVGLMASALAAVPYKASKTGHAEGIQCGAKMLLSTFKQGIVFAVFTWAAQLYSAHVADAPYRVTRSVTLATLNVMIVFNALLMIFHYSTCRIRHALRVLMTGIACIGMVIGCQYIHGVNIEIFDQLPLENGRQLVPVVVFPVTAMVVIEVLKWIKLREDEPDGVDDGDSDVSNDEKHPTEITRQAILE